MLHSESANGVPPYNNTIFSTSFVDAFFSIIIHANPNIKIHHSPENITPLWNEWSLHAPTEMLFNKTETDEPVVRGIKTDEKLLERCRLVERILVLYHTYGY
jgi:acetylcholinesterase